MLLHHEDMYRAAMQKQQQMLHEAKMARWAREANGPGRPLIDRLAKAYSSLLSILL